MDSIDIGILRALEVNCRVSYQELSMVLGMTANAVKKRMNKLVEKGTIFNYTVYLSHAMANLRSYLAIIETEGTQFEKEILEQIAKNPHVYSVALVSDSACIVIAQYDQSIKSHVFKKFLSEIDGVKNVDVHTERTSCGTRVEFTPLQLRVLVPLLDDARMAVSQLADRTGLTPRRIRRILKQLLEGGGLNFIARYNLNVGSSVSYYAQIYWNSEQADYNQIKSWLDKKFPGEYYDSHISTTTPMMLSVFVIENLKDAEALSQQISINPAIDSVRTLFPFPAKKNVRLQRIKLEELLKTSQQ